MHGILHHGHFNVFQTCVVFISADVFSKFEKSGWGQKLSARVSKSTTTDFQRYKWAVAKTKKSRAVRTELKKLQKSDS